jgi:hypothetical protein
MQLTAIVDRLGENNPQWWREVKGRCKPVNIALVAAISLVGQIFIYLYFQTLLPPGLQRFPSKVVNRYCTGDSAYQERLGSFNCIKDFNGDFIIFHQLWWLDMFRVLSYIIVIALLALGVYLLIIDLRKEESRGTLNFICLSPESSANILLGKLLGVPILVYLAVLLALPLHLRAGLGAGIPLGLLLGFYGVIIASCAFFYQVALVIALSTAKISNIFGALASAAVGVYLWGFSFLPMYSVNTLHWLAFFNPLLLLSPLVKSSLIPKNTHLYYNVDGQVTNFLWYNQPILQYTAVALLGAILHYGLWNYWLGKALNRRLTNPHSPFLRKEQSYWITIAFTTVGLGFVLSVSRQQSNQELFTNFALLQALAFVFILSLTVAMSPRRQHLIDWVRYTQKGWWQDLISGEKSPSTVAVGINVLLILAITLPAVLFSPLKQYKLATLLAFLAIANMAFIYGLLIQWLLMSKKVQQGVSALGIVAGFAFTSTLAAAMLSGANWGTHGFFLLFTFIPSVAASGLGTGAIAFGLVSQWVGMIAMGAGMTKRLQKAGISHTKALNDN